MLDHYRSTVVITQTPKIHIRLMASVYDMVHVLRWKTDKHAASLI